MTRMVLGLLVAAGCGGVSDKKMDAAVADSPPSIDAAIDGPGGDAGPTCVTDAFDGTTLQAHWSLLAGASPTYALTGGKLVITDAPFATTPSTGNESWLNDLDTDKGNQLGWAHAIGGQDFVVRTHLDFASTNNELMISGVGVADSQGTIATMIGFNDGTQSGFGIAWGAIRIGGAADSTTSGPGVRVETGGHDLRIERSSSLVRLYIDNVELAAGTVTDLISNVVIVAVPYKQNTNEYGYGTAELTHIEVCR